MQESLRKGRVWDIGPSTQTGWARDIRYLHLLVAVILLHNLEGINVVLEMVVSGGWSSTHSDKINADRCTAQQLDKNNAIIAGESE